MPLVIAPIGQDLRIIRISTNEKTKKHLESLGMIINSTIKILSQSRGGVICIVKGVRLALDNYIAVKIFVA